MKPSELQKGDYIVIQFRPEVKPQIAEVIEIDHSINTAILLPECQNETITISQEDQWKQIEPLPILHQVSKAFGFSETSVEMAYGWTSKSWTRAIYNGAVIFELTYADKAWTLEVCSIVNSEPNYETYSPIQFTHQLQHHLRPYNQFYHNL